MNSIANMRSVAADKSQEYSAVFDGAGITHDFALTEHWYVFSLPPAKVNPGAAVKALLGLGSFAGVVDFESSLYTPLVLIPRLADLDKSGRSAAAMNVRDDPRIKVINVPYHFSFHCANAFEIEENGHVVVDMVLMNRAVVRLSLRWLRAVELRNVYIHCLPANGREHDTLTHIHVSMMDIIYHLIFFFSLGSYIDWCRLCWRRTGLGDGGLGQGHGLCQVRALYRRPGHRTNGRTFPGHDHARSRVSNSSAAAVDTTPPVRLHGGRASRVSAARDGIGSRGRDSQSGHAGSSPERGVRVCPARVCR